jgi:hypothetical protein
MGDQLQYGYLEIVRNLSGFLPASLHLGSFERQTSKKVGERGRVILFFVQLVQVDVTGSDHRSHLGGRPWLVPTASFLHVDLQQRNL